MKIYRETKKMRWKAKPLLKVITAKEIRNHMTEAEKEEINRFDSICVRWLLGGIATPMLIALILSKTTDNFMFLALGFIITIFSYLALLRNEKRGKEFLCSTAWAKSQELSIDRIIVYKLEQYFPKMNSILSIGVLVILFGWLCFIFYIEYLSYYPIK